MNVPSAVSSKSAEAVTAVDIGREDACPAVFSRLKVIEKDVLQRILARDASTRKTDAWPRRAT